jgi:hypothetical protein
MGGIRLRNIFEESVLSNLHRWGTDVWIPPNDEQYIVASTSVADNTADADFTLATPITNLGNRLPWPCRLFVVLRNRGTIITGAPGITQVSPTFAGNDALEVKVTGKLAGRVQTETLTVNVANITSPTGQQRSHMLTSNHYDEITSVRHQNKTGTWGQTTPMQISVGLGNSEFGDASNNRIPLRFPFKIADTALLKRLLYLFDNTSAAVGTGLTNANIDNSSSSLLIPGKAASFQEFKAFTGQTADTLTSTSHGLTEGMVVQVADLGDNLGGLSARTNYYVANAAANTISLSTSRNITSWTTDLGADTLTKTAHGLNNDTPVLLYDIGNGLPGPLAAGTVYYIINKAANTIQLSATSGGALIDIVGANVAVGLLPLVDIAAGLLFANNDPILVMRPKAEWRLARLVFDDGLHIEGV